MLNAVSMVPLAARKVVHSVGDDMGMEQRPGAGDVLVLHGLASGAELIHDLLHIRMYFIVLRKGIFLGSAQETEIYVH
jgi:hypothetical protein